MTDEGFLVPPPGLLPPPRDPAPETAPVSTGSQTVRVRAPGVPVPAPTALPIPAGSPRPGAAPPPAPEPPAPEPPAGAWFLRLADGAEHELDAAGLVLGRNPTAPATHPDARPVRVDDPAKSVSKTHALLLPEEGRLRVLDLRSTNGVAVTPPTGEATVVPEDGILAAEGAVVALGDYAIAVGRRR
ncbi:FHA domain-containing protein [Pseudolysinimonas sp.]|uniref:FHA domain-containing protein n=1 Tax=Pseudolysinimonas sp. TaxID=2680009 RepID=UPI003F80E914